MSAEEGRIEFAETVLIDTYEVEVGQIIEALFDCGFTAGLEVFVSDMSRISDFPLETPEDYQKLSKWLGVPVSEENYIYEIAKRLRAADANTV